MYYGQKRRSGKSYGRTRKRYSRNQRTWRKAGANAGSLAYKAYKTANFVRGLINTEFKYVDNTINLTSIDNSTITWIPISLMAQGDDNNQRQGRSILCKRLNIRLKFALTGTLNYAAVRVIIVKYVACDGAYPNSNEIFTNPLDTNSFRNIQSVVNNYQIIMDKRFTMDPDNLNELYVDRYFNINQHIKYIGTTGAIGACGNNNYFIGFVSDVFSPTTGNYLQCAGFTRMRYLDN